jgi:hypothetical protein
MRRSQQADRIEEAGRPLAIYSFWHRAPLGIDRPQVAGPGPRLK